MINGFEQFQKLGRDNLDASVKSLDEVSKGFQAIAAELTGYTKKAFEDGTVAFEKLVGAKSLEQAIEIQTSYTKQAFDSFVGQVSKMSEMYVDLAKGFYKPVEDAIAKKS